MVNGQSRQVAAAKKVAGARKYRINIGPAAKLRRKELSLTLQDVAARSGLSVAFISQIENGKTTPSLVSLLQLSEALEVDMSYFVVATQEERLFRRGDEPEFIDVDSVIKYIRLGNPFPNQKLEPFIFSLQPGHQSSADKIGEGHPGEAFLYILEGEVHGEYRGNKFTLRPGDSMHYDLSVPLALDNLGTTVANILWVGSVVLFPPRKI